MPSAEISPALRAAAQEAFEASSALVPVAIRSEFVLVGGAAMLYHGSTRRTEDLDIAGSAASLWEFLQAAQKDERFSVAADGVFVQYTAVRAPGRDICVKIDLIDLGGEAVPNLLWAPIRFGDVYVASMPDLWRMKARAHIVTRPGEKGADMEDFLWQQQQMVKQRIDYDPVELLRMLLGELQE